MQESSSAPPPSHLALPFKAQCKHRLINPPTPSGGADIGRALLETPDKHKGRLEEMPDRQNLRVTGVPLLFLLLLAGQGRQGTCQE